MTEPEDQDRRKDDRAAEVARPPRQPDWAVVFPIRKTAQRQTGDADACADRGAESKREREPEYVVSMIKGAEAVCDLANEPGRGQCFDGVSDRDAKGGNDVSGGQDVDQKRPDEDAGPKLIAEEEQGRDRDSGRRPDRRRARVQEREFETQLAGNEIKGG